jgi:hypothetical protein
MVIAKASNDRLDLSERVLAGWEGMVAMGATPTENLRLIENELAILQNMSDEPERRARLIERYEALADGLRRGVN